MRLVVFVSLVGILWAGTAFGAGLGIAPASFTGTLSEGDLETFAIEVFNTANEPGMFQVYADDSTDWFVIQPEQFRLDPAESKKVKVIVQPATPGKFVANLSVVGRDLDRQSFNAASGLKFPVTLTVNKASASEQDWIMTLSVVLAFVVLIVGGLFVGMSRKRSALEQVTDSFDLLLHHKQKWYHKILRRIK